MFITLKNELTGQTRESKIGFSWTTFFFGFIPAFTRGDMKNGFIQLFITFIIGPFAPLVYSFIYNKIYIKDLLQNGFRPNDQHSTNLLRAKGFYFEPLSQPSMNA
jgi:hypothetical protein